MWIGTAHVSRCRRPGGTDFRRSESRDESARYLGEPRHLGPGISRKNPKARVVGVDWAPVLEIARENARAAGLENRFSTIAGIVRANESQMGFSVDVVLFCE